MGRTVPTLNQAISETIADLRKIRDGLNTNDKQLWDEFVRTGHLNERAISLAVIPDVMQCMMLAMLFKQFKMIKALGGKTEPHQEALDEPSSDSVPQ
jgi:hypothetical protein